jgi:uncharacterized membrane protein YcaP (DUF421 family)
VEPNVTLFLKAIVQSLSLILVWLLLNIFFGIRLGLLFLDQEITLWHGIYYLCMTISFVVLLRHLLAKWKKVPDFGKMEEESGD